MNYFRKTTIPVLCLALLACAFLPAAAGAATGRTVAVTATATGEIAERHGKGRLRRQARTEDPRRRPAGHRRRPAQGDRHRPGVPRGRRRRHPYGRINVRPVQKGKVTVYRAGEGIQGHPARTVAGGRTDLPGPGGRGDRGQRPSFSVGNQEEAFRQGARRRLHEGQETGDDPGRPGRGEPRQAITIEEGGRRRIRRGRKFKAEETAGTAAPVTPPTKPAPRRSRRPSTFIFELT